MKTFRRIIAIILFFGGMGTALTCVVEMAVFYFQNPDMTGLRRVMEYPEPTIVGLVAVLGSWIGLQMIARD